MTDQLRRDVVIAKGTGPRPADWADALYLQEVHLQCEFALRAYGEIRTRVDAGSNDLAMLAFAHMLLVFAGNAAKLVFPPPKANATATDRALRLRTKMGIGNAPPGGLADARNYFEHFDDRMDRFLSTHDGLLVHRLIAGGVSEEVELDDGRRFKPQYLQLLETASLDLTLYDQKVNLHGVAHEIESLQQNVGKALAQLKPTTPQQGPGV